MNVYLRFCEHCALVSVDPLTSRRPPTDSLGYRRGDGGCLGASGGLTPGTKSHDWRDLGEFAPIQEDPV